MKQPMTNPAVELIRAIFAASKPTKCCPWCPADYSDKDTSKQTTCTHRRRVTR